MIESFLGSVAANFFTNALKKRAYKKQMDLIKDIAMFVLGCFLIACLIACFSQFTQPSKVEHHHHYAPQINLYVSDAELLTPSTQ